MNSIKDALYAKDLLPPCMSKKIPVPEARSFRRYNENDDLLNEANSVNEITNLASTSNIAAKETKHKEKSLTNLFSDLKKSLRINSTEKDLNKNEEKESKKAKKRLSKMKDDNVSQESYQFHKASKHEISFHS